MPLSHYLAPTRTLFLQGRQRDEAIEELVAAICRDVPDLDQRTVWTAVTEREKLAGTRISPYVAVPHARLRESDRFVMAMGFAPEGVSWDSTEAQPVQMVFLILGPEKEAKEHLQILGDLARLFGHLPNVDPFAGATSPEELFHLLVAFQDAPERPVDSREMRTSKSAYAHAIAMAGEIGAASLILHADAELDLSFVSSSTGQPFKTLLVTSSLRKHRNYLDLFLDALEVPFSGLARSHRIKLSLLLALTKGLIKETDTVVCVSGNAGAGVLSTVEIMEIRNEFSALLGIQAELLSGQVNHQVLERLLSVVTGLANEGREGKPVGALFVLGDFTHVRDYCHQMVMNPFKGYDDGQKNILDPSLDETVKEFSSIDGAFIIRADGVIMSAGTYIRPGKVDIDLPMGLGTRHAAAMAITALTDAISVVLSESTGTVRVFKGGKLVTSVERAPR